MKNLFDSWLDTSEETAERRVLWRAKEIEGKREEIMDELSFRTSSHYMRDEEIATFLDVLGYDETAEIIKQNYPVGATGRSGDLGEILCAEIIEEWCDFKVPIRKLRYKDHREQAMRGEDVIGVRHNERNRLCLLKAEAKSAQALSTATVEAARSGLDSNSGRPSAHSMIYIARRLLEQGGREEVQGKEILLEASQNAVPQTRITHCLFAITGNVAEEMLDDDFTNASGGRDQFIVHVLIPDHANFIEQVYEGVVNLALK